MKAMWSQMLKTEFILLCCLPGFVSGSDAVYAAKAAVITSSQSAVAAQKPRQEGLETKFPPKPNKKIARPQIQAVSSTSLAVDFQIYEKSKIAAPDVVHTKTDGAVFQTLLTALAAMYGLFFAILGVVVQVGTQQSLSLLRRVFPVGKYIAWSLSLLFVQSCSMVFFTEDYRVGYSAFVANLIFLGWLTTHTIRFLDRNYVIERIVREYFND